jgi:mRNA interferase MazF
MTEYQKRFDEWNTDEKFINDSRQIKHVRKGQVWWASIGVNIGHEIDGKKNHFERPVLIIKKINKSSAFIIPLTSTIKPDDNRYVSYELDGQLKSACIAQAKMIDTRRLSRKANISLTSKDFGRIIDTFRNQFV